MPGFKGHWAIISQDPGLGHDLKMKFIKKFGNLFIPQKAERLSEIPIGVGDTVLVKRIKGCAARVYDNDGNINTQVDTSKQIEHRKMLELAWKRAQ